MADAGVAATQFLLQDLKRRVKEPRPPMPRTVKALLVDAIAELLQPLQRGLVVGAAHADGDHGRRRQWSRQDDDHRQAHAPPGRCRPARAAGGRRHLPRRRPRAAGRVGRPQPRRDRQPGRRRPRGRDLRCRQCRPGARLRRRHRRHRRPPADAAAPDGRAEEDPARDCQGPARGARTRCCWWWTATPARTRWPRCRPSMRRSASPAWWSPSSTARPRAACWPPSHAGAASASGRWPSISSAWARRLEDLQPFDAREFARALLD
jgi:hypothetical protein